VSGAVGVAESFVMKMAFYTFADIASYEVPIGKDDLLSSRLLKEEYNDKFTLQVVYDPYIQKVFTVQLGGTSTGQQRILWKQPLENSRSNKT
jgi:hypothetical protein